MFGLSDKIVDSLVVVFAENLKVDKAIVFGSRAKGNYKAGSDIDIAIKGQDLNYNDTLSLLRALDNLDLPYKIDLINYHTIQEPALIENIDRVGIELYSAWKEVKLGDVITFQRGHDLTRTEMGEGKYPVAGSNGIIGYHNIFTTKGPGVTIGRSGNIGTPHFYESDFWAHNTVLYIKDFKVSEPKFIYYFLKTIDFSQFNAGSSVPTLNRNHIHELDFILPPLAEQTAIANVLSSLDDKIDLLHRQNKTLEQLAETLFRQWFVEEAEDSWEVKKLGDLLTITSSKRIFYSEYVSFGIPFYRSKEIIELRKSGSTNSELYISKERFDEINNKFGSPKEGDILMTSVGTLGVAYRVRKFDKFYFKDGNLTWFKDFKGLPSSIIYLWLISKIGQEELAAITIGSTQEALTIEGLKSISFKIPHREKIKDYEIEFNSIIEKMEFNQTQIRTLTQTRDTLLPKLMSGEVRVNL